MDFAYSTRILFSPNNYNNDTVAGDFFSSFQKKPMEHWDAFERSSFSTSILFMYEQC